jgi:hypothetical protein
MSGRLSKSEADGSGVVPRWMVSAVLVFVSSVRRTLHRVRQRLNAARGTNVPLTPATVGGALAATLNEGGSKADDVWGSSPPLGFGKRFVIGDVTVGPGARKR